MSEQLLRNLDNLTKEAMKLEDEHPTLMAGENDGDNPLFDIMKDAWNIDKGGWIHLTFCCLDCDGGYSWSTLFDDLKFSREGIVRGLSESAKSGGETE